MYNLVIYPSCVRCTKFTADAMKQNTTNHRPLLDPQTVRLIRWSHGLQARIARTGQFRKSYVFAVVNRLKPPSEKFLDAMQAAMFEDTQERNTQAVAARYGRRLR